MSGDSEVSKANEVPAAWTYRAVVEEYESRSNQCTIYPRETAGIERMSTWITAREGSYVRLDTMR